MNKSNHADKSRVYLHELAAFAAYKQQKLARCLRRCRFILVLERLLPMIKLGALIATPALAYILARIAAPGWLTLHWIWQGVLLFGWLAILGGVFTAVIILIYEMAAFYRQCLLTSKHQQEKPLWHYISAVLEAKRTGRWPPH